MSIRWALDFEARFSEYNFYPIQSLVVKKSSFALEGYLDNPVENV